jgi:ubiquinone/menaquinone biosynthesis C-methylase UbiE
MNKLIRKNITYSKLIIITLIIIIIILFIIYIFLNKKSKELFSKNLLEHFEDKFNEDDNNEYKEIYDKEFVDYYQIIYNDSSDLDNDLKIVYDKAFKDILDSKDLEILVAGCGVGKLCKKLKQKYKNVRGIDISQNMLLKAQTLNPNIKFIRGNLVNSNIFKGNTFTHIYVDERTLYYNNFDQMKTIIENIYSWLKVDGYLIIPIYDKNKLQLAARYYSTKFIDDKKIVHGFTYLNNFSHNCYYVTENRLTEINKEFLENDFKEKNDKEIINQKMESSYNKHYYFDKIILDNGKKKIKKTEFYFPDKELIYDLIIKSGFETIHIEKIRRQIVGGYELAIFQKKYITTTVEKLQKK